MGVQHFWHPSEVKDPPQNISQLRLTAVTGFLVQQTLRNEGQMYTFKTLHLLHERAK